MHIHIVGQCFVVYTSINVVVDSVGICMRKLNFDVSKAIAVVQFTEVLN